MKIWSSTRLLVPWPQYLTNSGKRWQKGRPQAPRQRQQQQPPSSPESWWVAPVQSCPGWWWWWWDPLPRRLSRVDTDGPRCPYYWYGTPPAANTRVADPSQLASPGRDHRPNACLLAAQHENTPVKGTRPTPGGNRSDNTMFQTPPGTSRHGNRPILGPTGQN